MDLIEYYEADGSIKHDNLIMLITLLNMKSKKSVVTHISNYNPELLNFDLNLTEENHIKIISFVVFLVKLKKYKISINLTIEYYNISLDSFCKNLYKLKYIDINKFKLCYLCCYNYIPDLSFTIHISYNNLKTILAKSQNYIFSFSKKLINNIHDLKDIDNKIILKVTNDNNIFYKNINCKVLKIINKTNKDNFAPNWSRFNIKNIEFLEIGDPSIYISFIKYFNHIQFYHLQNLIIYDINIIDHFTNLKYLHIISQYDANNHSIVTKVFEVCKDLISFKIKNDLVSYRVAAKYDYNYLLNIPSQIEYFQIECTNMDIKFYIKLLKKYIPKNQIVVCFMKNNIIQYSDSEINKFNKLFELYGYDVMHKYLPYVDKYYHYKHFLTAQISKNIITYCTTLQNHHICLF